VPAPEPNGRPFRFGIIVGRQPGRLQEVLPPATLRDLGRELEDCGFSTLVVPDHLSNQYAPFGLLHHVAAATTTLRLGTLVICNDLRHPAVLAKEAATLDVLSEGRLELGIGAGWQLSDYETTGIPFDRPGVRIDRLAEAVAALRVMFEDGPATFSGRHYTLSGVEAEPKPVQRPHPPLFLGGGGRRMLSLAAREADIVGIVVSLDSPGAAADLLLPAVEEKVGWVRDAAGDRFDLLELSIFPFLVGRDPVEVASMAAQQGSAEDVLASPFVLAGDTDQMVDTLLERRDRLGISYVTVRLEHLPLLRAVVDRLAGT